MTKRIMCESCKETYSEENMDECPNCYGDYCFRCINRHRFGWDADSKGCDAIFKEVKELNNKPERKHEN